MLEFDSIRDWLWEYREWIGLVSALIAIFPLTIGAVRMLLSISSKTIENRRNDPGPYGALLERFVGRQDELTVVQGVFDERGSRRTFIVNISGKVGTGLE